MPKWQFFDLWNDYCDAFSETTSRLVNLTSSQLDKLNQTQYEQR